MFLIHHLYFCFLPEFVFLVFILVILGFAVLKKKWHNHIDFTNLITMLSIAIVIFVVILFTQLLNFNFILLDGHFIISPFLTYCKIFVLILTICSLLISLDYFKNERLQLFEFPILILLASWGMLLVLSSNDF